MTIVASVLLLLSLSATGFYCYAIYAAIDFLGRPNPIDPDFHPPITILKPICGIDSDAYETLASFCQQDYPEYQIVFGVRDEQDAAVEVVQKIIHNFPDVDIQLVVSDRTIGTNFKVSNLANAQVEAKHSILLIADSDIRVEPDYLRRVIQPMRDPTVGVVTCLYRSLTQGWIATIEALWISTQFDPSVLVAWKLEGIKFAFGSTIVIQKAALEAIGGFPAIADYLADDFQLGKLPAEAGYKVVLSDYVVEHVLPTASLADSLKRQTRWARGTRVSRPWGYLGLIFTHGTATSLLLLLTTQGSILGWSALGITWSTRLVMGWVVGVRCLKDPVAKKFLWLVPLRDLISFALWCYSFVGNAIEWRGRRLRLIKGGKLVPLLAGELAGECQLQKIKDEILAQQRSG
jgi:ceramide glucosyltransferase